MLTKHKDLITNDQLYRIKQVEYLKDGMYANLDIPATLDFYYNRYVLQLGDFKKITKDTIINYLFYSFKSAI